MGFEGSSPAVLRAAYLIQATTKCIRVKEMKRRLFARAMQHRGASKRIKRQRYHRMRCNIFSSMIRCALNRLAALRAETTAQEGVEAACFNLRNVDRSLEAVRNGLMELLRAERTRNGFLILFQNVSLRQSQRMCASSWPINTTHVQTTQILVGKSVSSIFLWVLKSLLL